MDTALLLRKYYDEKISLTDKEIDRLLKESNIIKKLINDYEENGLFNVFRIVCLAEIPYVYKLPYTRQAIDFISKNLATPQGFSYTGKVDDIVPCYNAMLLEAYVRLGLIKSKEVENSLNWIKKYQVYDRNEVTTWNYMGIKKHGGCMKAIPCYIGIGKTIRALITYAEYSDHKDMEVEEMISQGSEYMLRHHMFQRLTNHKPISNHIINIMFPQSYMLSLVDLVYIANKRNLWNDARTIELAKLLKEKEIRLNEWKVDYIYQHKGYKSFDTRRNVSDWVNYIINNK